jgi:DNA mismatch repair protein MutL
MTGIQTLTPEIVNLIAAGEVIDSLAAVVRELVENALDAGASRIAVSVWAQQWRVRVADNGTGMSLADLQRAASPHSTSKIRSCNDLWQLTSLGFRGEALHSIATLAELEILSRPTGTVEGWRVVYDARGEVVAVTDAAIAPGTVVTVSNLFAPCPVRRKGLPSTAQQLRAIQAIVQHVALCHPHVTWQVEQNGRPWFTLSPGKTAREILPQILRQVRPSDLQQLTIQVPTPEPTDDEANSPEVTQFPLRGSASFIAGFPGNYALPIPHSPFPIPHSPFPIPHSHLHLLIGLPDRCHRRRPDWIKVATNGRIVRTPELEQTILSAFSRTLPRDRFPICFLHLEICPSQIDWNRHPAKTEIYLHSVDYWREQVARAIEQALRLSPETLPTAAHSHRVTQLLKVSEEKGAYHVNRSVQPAAPETEPEIGFGAIALQAVAQVRNMYILAEHPTGMWLIEQHIAHERILYEEICDRWQLVPLEPPIVLDCLTPAQVEQLRRLGLEVDPFGEQLWAVRNAPALLQPRDDCADALLELSLGGDLQSAQVATACRSAIRNGTPLSLPEMQALLDRWQKTRNPRTCPHGRPIYLSLEESALARFFRRHWVIGKSHGI